MLVLVLAHCTVMSSLLTFKYKNHHIVKLADCGVMVSLLSQSDQLNGPIIKGFVDC